MVDGPKQAVTLFARDNTRVTQLEVPQPYVPYDSIVWQKRVYIAIRGQVNQYRESVSCWVTGPSISDA